MEYELRRSMRSRTMRLAVHPDARVVVTAPRLFGLGAIERFVLKHSDWISRHVERAKGRTVIRIGRSEIPALKRQALVVAGERCAYFAAQYGLTFKKITIREQKSRWGSCSRRGNLSFNYKIAALPARIADYVIVHELCHLRHFNHSKDFWALVEECVPEHKRIRAELRNALFLKREIFGK